MERYKSILPWLVIWLPAMVVTAVIGTMGIMKLFYAPPPSFPPLVGSIPRTTLTILESERPQAGEYIYNTAEPTPFTADEAFEVPTATKPPQFGEEKIRLTGVFIVNGKKMCIINGVGYREGSSIYDRGIVTYIGVKGVVIRVNNEQKNLLVGQEAKI